MTICPSLSPSWYAHGATGKKKNHISVGPEQKTRDKKYNREGLEGIQVGRGLATEGKQLRNAL